MRARGNSRRILNPCRPITSCLTRWYELEGTTSTPITTLEQWAQQRQWIRSEFERWVYGKMPPPPDNLRAVVTETRREGGVTVREVRLEFGPDHRGILHLHLFIPDGKAPFPVFLTNQPRTASWIQPRDSPRLFSVYL